MPVGSVISNAESIHRCRHGAVDGAFSTPCSISAGPRLAGAVTT